MPSVPYAERTRRPARVPLDRELARVLKVSGRDRDGFRDHVIIVLAAGTGLRESEIVALDVGDVLTSPARTVRSVVELRVFKRAPTRAPERVSQRVHLPASVWYKLDKFARVGDFPPCDMYDNTPLFRSKKGGRLSTRAVRAMWRRWQVTAGIDRPYGFHALRHYAITLVRRETGDLSVAQRFARHANAGTTNIYNHVSDDELAAAVRDLPIGGLR